MTGLVVAIAIVCATALIGLGLVLSFGRAVMKQTGKSESLRDAAVLVRAFRPGSGGLLSALAKIFRRG